MPARFKLVIICLLLTLLSVHVLAQSSGIPINDVIDISDTTDFGSYPISVVSDSTLNIELSPSDGTMARARVLLLNEEGLILLENLADRDELEAGASLSVPLVAGDYQVIATLSENDDITSGTFNINIDLVDDTVLDLFDVSEERLIEIGYPEFEARETVSWTIFAYYGADTDLEEAIIEDTNEFELAVEEDDMDIHVIVLLDRSPEYSDIDGNWDGTRLYKIGSDETPTMEDMIAIDSTPLHEFDELDMGDPETLAAFLTWGVQNYPAENYVVSFGSHGAGWRGVIVDQTDDNNSLTMPNLQQAFDTVRAETDFDSFDLLINDACLMASIEYYDVMQEYFNMSVGSAELVTNPALDMTTMTTALQGILEADRGNMSEVGRQLVDQYINVDSNPDGTRRNFTNAVTDLGRFGRVNAALDDFARVVNEDPRLHVPTLTQARANTYTYNRLFGATDQIDLGDFMEQIIFVSTDFEILIPAAQGVIDALNNARIYGNAGSFAIERTSYYNIFFPLDASGLNDYFGDSGLDSWEQMLINYFAFSRFELWTSGSDGVLFHQPQKPEINITGSIPFNAVASFNLPIAVDIEVQATNVSRGTLFVEQVIGDDESIRLLATPLLEDVPVATSLFPLRNQNVWRSGVDIRTVKWNAGAFEISDGEQSNIEFLQQTFDDSGAYFLEGQYRRTEDADWIAVKVTFTDDSQHQYDLRSSTFISINEQAGTFGVFEPETGSQLQVFRTEVDLDDGDIDIEDDGNIYQIGETGLGATLVPVTSGDYVLRFRIDAFGQDSGEDVLGVTVNNDVDNIDPEWRGQNYVNESSFSVALPVYWGLDFDERNGELNANMVSTPPRIGDIYGNGNYVLIREFPGVRDLNQVRELFISSFSNELGDNLSILGREIIDGQDVEYFTHVEGFRTIRSVSTYNEASDTAMTFSIALFGQDSEISQTLFDEFIARLHFYEDTDNSEGSIWRYETIGVEQSVAIPTGWEMSTDEAGWTVYASETGDNSVSFIKLNDEGFNIVDYAVEFLENSDVSANDIQIYSGESHIWQSIQYTSSRGDVNYIGRFYQTVKNDSNYIVWVESAEEIATDVYSGTLDAIISSIVIEDRFITHDMLDSYGMQLSLSNPLLEATPFNPFIRTTLTGVDKITMVSPRNDMQIEAYFVPSVTLDNSTVWFSSYLEGLGFNYELSQYGFIEVSGQRALEIDVALTTGEVAWNGRYFIVYSEQDDMLYVIGVRGTPNSSIDSNYVHIRDNIQFQFGNSNPYTSILNYDFYDPQYAIDVDVWEVSSTQFVRNREHRVDWMRFANDQFNLEVYFFNGVETDNLREELGRFSGGAFAPQDNNTLIDMTIDGRPAVQIQQSNPVGQFIAVYDEERSRIVLIGAQFRGASDITSLPVFERILETFTIFPLE